MSTVLWGNVLVHGKVTSGETDHLMLYKHAEKLDSIARALQLPGFLTICDTTDQRFNLDQVALPAGMASTNELMALRGSWMAAAEAVSYLSQLRDYVVARSVRFGLISNQQSQVVAELNDVIGFLKVQGSSAEKFNFSVVT